MSGSKNVLWEKDSWRSLNEGEGRRGQESGTDLYTDVKPYSHAPGTMPGYGTGWLDWQVSSNDGQGRHNRYQDIKTGE